MKRIVFITVFLWSLIPEGISQETQKRVALNGYITSMQSAMFDSLSGPVTLENLLHNRLNFKGFINEHITVAAELRNRLFTGDMARSGPSYSELINADKGMIDMSWNLVSENSFFFNTSVDRLWLDLNYEKLQVRIGRQRINWGQTFVWNPNDIFNTYSFFDFDYVERPGSDAIRIQYYPTWSSAFELAVKADSDDDVTAAGLYRFSKWSYDIQFLAGYSNSSDLVAGAGWSGAIKSVSFRGELSFFHPIETKGDTINSLILTAGIDKLSENNSMLQFQVMYCNNPMELNNFNSFYSGNLSAKDLAFSKFSAFGSFSWAATPLLNITGSAMWFPDLKGYFAGPSADYSLADNVDCSVIWQHFNSMMGGTRSRINLAFLRIRYSF